jgi:hypothetical protein
MVVDVAMIAVLGGLQLRGLFVGTCMISFNRQSRVVVRKRSLEGRDGEEEVLFNDKGAPKFFTRHRTGVGRWFLPLPQLAAWDTIQAHCKPKP